MKTVRHLIGTVAVVLLFFVINSNLTKAKTLKTIIPFKGTASGGTLCLVGSGNRNAVYWMIETKPGESPETVVDRLTSAMTDPNRLDQMGRPLSQWGIDLKAKKMEMSQGNSLKMGGWIGTQFLSGTETGLGIPPPPLSLSCRYDPQTDTIIAEWVNPPGGYDKIAVVMGGTTSKLLFDLPDPNVRPPPPPHPYSQNGWIDGKSQQYVLKRGADIISGNDLDIRVFGFREFAEFDKATMTIAGIPSAAAVIHLNGRRQEEISGFPFARNLAPNWSFWSTAGPDSTGAVEQGQKYNYQGNASAVTYTLPMRPFYQIIRAPKAGQSYGVWRQFLGLTGGHKYRVIACISTLDMENIKGDWSFSLHAAANDANGRELTPEQMTGLTTLPDGRKGPDAGRLFSYGPGRTTAGKFELVSSDESTNVTLPQDANKVTLWARFNCDDPNGRIGFSGVIFEDITGIDQVKPLEEFKLQAERDEQQVLRIWKAEKIIP